MVALQGRLEVDHIFFIVWIVSGLLVQNVGSTFSGKCGRDGMFYYDDYRFIMCSHGIGYMQHCAPGTKNSGPMSFVYGDPYATASFCDVNLLAQGYIRQVENNAHAPQNAHRGGQPQQQRGYGRQRPPPPKPISIPPSAGYGRPRNAGYNNNNQQQKRRPPPPRKHRPPPQRRRPSNNLQRHNTGPPLRQTVHRPPPPRKHRPRLRPPPPRRPRKRPPYPRPPPPRKHRPPLRKPRRHESEYQGRSYGGRRLGPRRPKMPHYGQSQYRPKYGYYPNPKPYSPTSFGGYNKRSSAGNFLFFQNDGQHRS